MSGRELSPEQASRVYDRIGRLQDWQQFYEGPAIRNLMAHAGFEQARSVFELGCGTGAMAEHLLADVVAPDATYLGVDVSPRMVALARSRLKRFGDRARVELVRGTAPLPGESGTFDHFVAVYVFDLLSPLLAAQLLAEADRLLAGSGRLCLVSLGEGRSGASRVVCSVWDRIWRHAPALVGGCHPIDLAPLLAGTWTTDHMALVTAWGVSSQVVVATPAGTAGRQRPAG